VHYTRPNSDDSVRMLVVITNACYSKKFLKNLEALYGPPGKD